MVNLLNRLVDLTEDAANQIRGTDVVARHRRGILASGLAVLLASFVATALAAPVLLPFRLAFHALGFAYNWPLLPGCRRIKQLVFWKNAASATGFLLTVFCYPVAIFPVRADVTNATVASAALFFFLFELSYEVLYDLRDVEGDRLADVRTWPVLFGVSRGFLVAQAQMIAAVLVVAAGSAVGILPWRITVMGAAPLLQLAISRRMVKRGITTADCIVITWIGVALLGTYHVWEVLGLPGAESR